MKYLIFALSLLFNISIANTFQATILPIPNTLKFQMEKTTWRSGCPTPIDSLALIKLTYWGFDNVSHDGELIIDKTLTKEIVAIFNQCYLQHIAFQQIKPIELFNGDDIASMSANNTSAFNCRKRSNRPIFSMHAYGRAIDINPLFNPYVDGNLLLPPTATSYAHRHQHQLGMIDHNSALYKIFKKYGWQWGGDWIHLKDYQHFEKQG